MDPALAARIRRHWPVVAALALAVVFLLVHLVVFQPLAGRYRHALTRASALGLMIDPAHPGGPPPLSPRVFTLLMDNSLPAAELDTKAQSGSLAAEAVQSLSALASQHGLAVVVAEPGLLTQQPGSTEVRAHLRMKGSYPGFLALLDDLARGGRLWSVERFAITPAAGEQRDIEVWFASCVLRRGGGPS